MLPNIGIQPIQKKATVKSMCSKSVKKLRGKPYFLNLNIFVMRCRPYYNTHRLVSCKKRHHPVKEGFNLVTEVYQREKVDK